MSTSAAPLPPSLAERVRPVALAGEQLLPVDATLSSVLGLPGLVRGTTVAVGGPVAVTSLAVALAARASASGSWVAAVGLTSLGLTAAEGLGLSLERLVVVAPPEPARWAAVLAALVEGFDVVLAGPPVRVRAPDARRLVARLRERRSVLVQVGWPPGCWPTEPELSLGAGRVRWEGIGPGWGHCHARRVEVELTGRRGAGRPRRGWLWLPGPDGRLAAAGAIGEAGAVGEPGVVGELTIGEPGAVGEAGVVGELTIGEPGAVGEPDEGLAGLAAGADGGVGPAAPPGAVPGRARLNLVPGRPPRARSRSRRRS